MPPGNPNRPDYKRLKLYLTNLDFSLYDSPAVALAEINSAEILDWITSIGTVPTFTIDGATNITFPAVCSPYQTMQTLQEYHGNENRLDLLNTILFTCTFDRRISLDSQVYDTTDSRLSWEEKKKYEISNMINKVAIDLYNGQLITKLIDAFKALLDNDKMRRDSAQGNFQPGTKTYEDEKKLCVYRHNRKIVILEAILLAFHHHGCGMSTFKLLTDVIIDQKSFGIDDEQKNLLRFMVPFPETIANKFIDRVERLLVMIVMECLDLNQHLATAETIKDANGDFRLLNHPLYPLAGGYDDSLSQLKTMFKIYKKFRNLSIQDLFTRIGYPTICPEEGFNLNEDPEDDINPDEDPNSLFYSLTNRMDWPILHPKLQFFTDDTADMSEWGKRVLLHNDCMQVANQSPWVVITLAISSSLQYTYKLYSVAAMAANEMEEYNYNGNLDNRNNENNFIIVAADLFKKFKEFSIVNEKNHPYHDPDYFIPVNNDNTINFEKYTRLLSPYEDNPLISVIIDNSEISIGHFWYSPINPANAYGYLSRTLQEICSDFIPAPYLNERIDTLKTSNKVHLSSSSSSNVSSQRQKNTTTKTTTNTNVQHDTWQEVESELNLPEEDRDMALQQRIREGLRNALTDTDTTKPFIGIDLDMQTDPFRADILDDALYQRGSLTGGPIPGQVTVSSGVRLTIPHHNYAVYMPYGLDKICAGLVYNYVSSIIKARFYRFERPLPSPLHSFIIANEDQVGLVPMPIGTIELENVLQTLKCVYQIDSSLAALAWKTPQNEGINFDLDTCILNYPPNTIDDGKIEPHFEIAAIFNACKLLWPMVSINPLLDFANSLCTPRTVPHVLTYLHTCIGTLTLNIGLSDQAMEEKNMDILNYVPNGNNNKEGEDKLPSQWYPQGNTPFENLDPDEYTKLLEFYKGNHLNYPVYDPNDDNANLFRNRYMIYHEIPQIGNNPDQIVRISATDEPGTLYNPMTIGLNSEIVTFSNYGLRFNPESTFGSLLDSRTKLVIVDANKYHSIWTMLFLRLINVVDTLHAHSEQLDSYRSLARGIAVQNSDDFQILAPLFLELQNMLMIFNHCFKYFVSKDYLRYNTYGTGTDPNDQSVNNDNMDQLIDPNWPFHDIPFTAPFSGIPAFIQEGFSKKDYTTGNNIKYLQYTREDIILDIFNYSWAVLKLLDPIVQNLAHSEASGILVNHLPMPSRIVEQQTTLQQFRSVIREPGRLAASLVSTLVTQYSEIICPSILQKIRHQSLMSGQSSVSSSNVASMMQTDEGMDPVQITYHYFLDIDQVTKRYGITLPLLRLVYHLTYYIVRRRSCLDFSLAFDQFDNDKGGTIDVTEFRNELQRIGLRISSTTLGALIRELDRDGDREIDYNEFVRFALRHLHRSESSNKLLMNGTTDSSDRSSSKSLLQMGNGMENSVLKYSMLHSSSSAASSRTLQDTESVENELTNFIQTLTLSDTNQQQVEESMLHSAFDLAVTTLRTSTISTGHLGVQLLLQVRALRLLDLLLRSKAVVNSVPYGKLLAEDILSSPSDEQGSVTNSLMFIIYQLPLFVVNLQMEMFNSTVPVNNNTVGTKYYNEYIGIIGNEDRLLLQTATLLALKIINLLFLHTPMDWEPVTASSSSTSFGVAGGMGSKVPVAMHGTNNNPPGFGSISSQPNRSTNPTDPTVNNLMYLEEIDATDYNAVSKANIVLRYPIKIAYTDNYTKTSTNQATPISLLFALVGYYSGEPTMYDLYGWIQPESIRSASLGTLTLLSRCMSRVLLHIDTFSPRSGGLKVASIAATAAASVILQPSTGINTAPNHQGGWRNQTTQDSVSSGTSATSMSTAAVANSIINQINTFTQLTNDRSFYELDHYLLPHGEEIRFILFGSTGKPLNEPLTGMLRFACTYSHTDPLRVGAIRFARTLLDNQSSALAILFASDFNDKVREKLENNPKYKDLYNAAKERKDLETKLQKFSEDKDLMRKNFSEYAKDEQRLKDVKKNYEDYARVCFNENARLSSPSLFSLLVEVLNPERNVPSKDYIIESSNSVLRPVLLVETLSFLIALWRSAAEAGVHTYEVNKLRTDLYPSLSSRLKDIISGEGGYNKIAELTKVSAIYNVCISTHNQYLRGKANPDSTKQNSRFHGGLVQGSLTYFNQSIDTKNDEHLYNVHALRRYAYVVTARALACQLYAMDLQWYGVPDSACLPSDEDQKQSILHSIKSIQDLLDPADRGTQERLNGLDNCANVLTTLAEHYIGSFDSTEDGTDGETVNKFIKEIGKMSELEAKQLPHMVHLLVTGSAIEMRAYAQLAKLARQYAADDGVNLQNYSQHRSNFSFPAFATYGPGPLTSKRLQQNFDITAVWGSLNGTDTTTVFTDDVVRKAVAEGTIKHLHNAIGPGNRLPYLRYGTEFDYDVTTLAMDLGLSDTWLHMVTNLPTNVQDDKLDQRLLPQLKDEGKAKIGEIVYGKTGARKEKLDADGSILWATALQSSISSVMVAQTNLVRSLTGLLITIGSTRIVTTNNVPKYLSLIPLSSDQQALDNENIPSVQYPRLYTSSASVMFARLAIGLDGGHALGVGEDGHTDMQILQSVITLAECGNIFLAKEKELMNILQKRKKQYKDYEDKWKNTKIAVTMEEKRVYTEDKFLVENIFDDLDQTHNNARLLGLWNSLLSIRTALERNQLHPSKVNNRAAVQPALNLLTILLSSALYICKELLETKDGESFINSDLDRIQFMSMILYQLAECSSLALKASRDAMKPKTVQEDTEEQERQRKLREGIFTSNQASMIGRSNNVTNASISAQYQDRHHQNFPRLDSERLATLRSSADLYSAASALFVWLIQRPQLLQDFATKAENICLTELSDMHSNYNNPNISVSNIRNGKISRTPLDLLEPWLLDALHTAKNTFDDASKNTAFLLDCHDKAWQSLIQSRIQIAAHHLSIANSFGMDAKAKSSAMADALAAFNGLLTMDAAKIPQPVQIEIDANATFILMSIRIASNVATIGYGNNGALDGAGAYAVGQVRFPEAIVQSPLFSRTEASLAERLDAQMDKYAGPSRGETKKGITPTLATKATGGNSNRSNLNLSSATNNAWTTVQKVSLANNQYVGGIVKIPYYYAELQKVKIDPKIIFFSCGFGLGPSNDRGYRSDAERCTIHQAWTESVSLLNTVIQLPAGGIHPFSLPTAVMVGNLRILNATFIEYYRLTMHTSLTARPIFTIGNLEENTAIAHFLACMYSNRPTPLPKYSRSVNDINVDESMIPLYCLSSKTHWETRTKTSLPMSNFGSTFFSIVPCLIAYLLRDLVGLIGGWRSCVRPRDLAYLFDVNKELTKTKKHPSNTDETDDHEDFSNSIVHELSNINVTWEITDETARFVMGSLYENIRLKAVSKRERELEKDGVWITINDTSILHCLSGCINTTFASQKLALEGKWKQEKLKQIQKITSQLKTVHELTPSEEAFKYHEFVVEGMNKNVQDPFEYAKGRIQDIKREVKADMEVQEQYVLDLQNSKLSLINTSTVLSSTTVGNSGTNSDSGIQLVEASNGLRDYVQILIDRSTNARTIANEMKIISTRKSQIPDTDPLQRVFDQQILELQTKSLENYVNNPLTPFAQIDGLNGSEKSSMGDKEPPRPGLAHLVIAIAFALSYGVGIIDQNNDILSNEDPFPQNEEKSPKYQKSLKKSTLDKVVETYRKLKVPKTGEEDDDDETDEEQEGKGNDEQQYPMGQQSNDESDNYPYQHILFRYHIPRIIPGNSISLVSSADSMEIATIIRQGIGILSHGIDIAARGARMDEKYTRSLLECIVKSIGDNHLLTTMLNIIDSKDGSLSQQDATISSSGKSVISSPSTTNQSSFAPTTITRTTLGSRYGYGMNPLRYQNSKKKISQQTGIWLNCIQFICGNVYLPSTVTNNPEYSLAGHLASMRTLLTRTVLHGTGNVPNRIREPGYSLTMVRPVHPLDDDAYLDRMLINMIGNLNIRLGFYNPTILSLPITCIDPLSYVILGNWSQQRDNDFIYDQTINPDLHQNYQQDDKSEWLTIDPETLLFNVFKNQRQKKGKRTIKAPYGVNKSPKYL